MFMYGIVYYYVYIYLCEENGGLFTVGVFILFDVVVVVALKILVHKHNRVWFEQKKI